MNKKEMQTHIESLMQTNVSLAEFLRFERATWRAREAELEQKVKELEAELAAYRGTHAT